MRFGPITFRIIGILGMVSGATGCHSSHPPLAAALFPPFLPWSRSTNTSGSKTSTANAPWRG